MGLLEGKTALITGGARGQGRAHAVESARHGADVIVVDVDQDIATVPYDLGTKEELAETVRQVEALDRRAIGVVGDVRSQVDMDEAVRQGIAEFGKIDILIANAGILSIAPVWELSDEQWHDMLDVNLTGVWRAVKAVVPHMIERRTGSIVMTSSINGDDPDAGVAHYTASKHGVLGLMKSVALEVAEYGIRCNAVKPAMVRSMMTAFPKMLDRYAGHTGGTMEDMRRAGYHYHALPQTMMEPEMIANTAVFLNSHLASVVTGTALLVDAGHQLLPAVNRNPSIPD
jgi:SDR family mycofactocin-dependent oxidoreductase